MMDFSRYLRGAGVPEHQIAGASGRITSWHDLWRWLDVWDWQRAPQLTPRRTPIRTPVLPLSWRDRVRAQKNGRASGGDTVEPGWVHVVQHRQRVTLSLALATTLAMSFMSFQVLKAQQVSALTIEINLAIYATMIFFLANNFFKLALGTWHVTNALQSPWHPRHRAIDPRPGARVAIVFPVYHEDAARVAAGIAATWESIREGFPQFAQHFDIFLLSDSKLVEFAIAERSAMTQLQRQFRDARFFYRRRTVNKNAKLGNISDFCRRWGVDYEYMLVMDADSVMDGTAIIALLRMMEGNRRIGILQTNPKPVLRETMFGRVQQFAARLYGSVFSYSLQAMYMGHGSYIGHNALVRIQPFIEHCSLPDLSGPVPWGGKPLSHDIVESAMMARAGHEVWFLPDIEGSYEEIPGNFVTFLARERRWMQGNLQHIRFILLNGLRPVHRETLINGSMGYLAAPLWAFFLLVSTFGMLQFMQYGLLVLGSLRAIQLPAMTLLVSSLVFLFLPRLFALLLHMGGTEAAKFGGKRKLVLSVILETLFSLVFSPIMMIFITRFFWLWITRQSVKWGVQDRGDEPLSWHACVKHFGWVSVIGLICTAGVAYQISHVPYTQEVLLTSITGGWGKPIDLLLWMSPILGGFSASVLIARYSSFPMPRLKRLRMFAIPEETAPPPVVQRLMVWLEVFRAEIPDSDGAAIIREAVSNPTFYLEQRPHTRRRPHVAEQLLPLIRAQQRLTNRQWLAALHERGCLDELHKANAPT